MKSKYYESIKARMKMNDANDGNINDVHVNENE